MHISNSLKEIKESFGLTIGNFDGVHLGHQKLINELKKRIIKEGVDNLVVMTFHPHPSEILNPSRKHFLINSNTERRNLMKALGVNHLVEINFNRDFSMMSPEDFLTDHVLCNSNLKVLHLGYDFAFGENKKGDASFIKQFVEQNFNEISISTQEELKSEKDIVSSTLIRKLVEEGSFEKVTSLLGRPFFVEDVIVKGNMRGRTIGFPTANLTTNLKRIYPGNGVYVSQTVYKGMLYQSITNVGVNPTFEEDIIKRLETHIFDFDQDIYGERIHVELLKKIRNEIKFNSVNELVGQIKEDINTCRKYFEQN